MARQGIRQLKDELNLRRDTLKEHNKDMVNAKIVYSLQPDLVSREGITGFERQLILLKNSQQARQRQEQELIDMALDECNRCLTIMTELKQLRRSG